MGGISAVTSHTLTTAQEDKYNLEGRMKVKYVLICNIRPVIDLPTGEYDEWEKEHKVDGKVN